MTHFTWNVKRGARKKAKKTPGRGNAGPGAVADVKVAGRNYRVLSQSGFLPKIRLSAPLGTFGVRS